ncbi:MAG: hypothetical protein MUC87_01365 [Bacteroidia bacterium]|jgi:hypothetical protein|nr:hypothetical protein [Bacteroidia bacterium]
MLLRKILSPAILFLAVNLSAQDNISYKVVHDRPRDVNNFVMALDLAQLDFGFKNIDGLSFNIGVWGYANYRHTLCADYIFRMGWFTAGRLGDKEARRHTQVEAGVSFGLLQREVQKVFNVTLKSTTSRQNNYDVTTTQYIQVPGLQYRVSGVRAGFMHYGGPLSEPKDTDFGIVNYAVYGVYAGLFRTRTDNLRISTDKYGIRGYSHNVRVYLDATFVPVSTFKDPDPAYYNFPVGVRLGAWILPSLPRKEAKGMYNKGVSWQMEIGLRRFDGFYMQGTLAVPLARKKLKALGAEDNEPVRTSE